jgi:uncharacterized protein (AIM24 family)
MLTRTTSRNQRLIGHEPGAPRKGTANPMLKERARDGESEHIIRFEVDGGAWVKADAAIAYRGDVKFEHPPVLEVDLNETPTQSISPLTRASGSGVLYCAHNGQQLRVLELAGGTLCVTSESLLAFAETLRLEIVTADRRARVEDSSPLAVRLSGHGKVAFAIHGGPLTMKVTPADPFPTDAH